jgi:hypothetical protein
MLCDALVGGADPADRRLSPTVSLRAIARDSGPGPPSGSTAWTSALQSEDSGCGVSPHRREAEGGFRPPPRPRLREPHVHRSAHFRPRAPACTPLQEPHATHGNATITRRAARFDLPVVTRFKRHEVVTHDHSAALFIEARTRNSELTLLAGRVSAGRTRRARAGRPHLPSRSRVRHPCGESPVRGVRL